MIWNPLIKKGRKVGSKSNPTFGILLQNTNKKIEKVASKSNPTLRILFQKINQKVEQVQPLMEQSSQESDAQKKVWRPSFFLSLLVWMLCDVTCLWEELQKQNAINATASASGEGALDVSSWLSIRNAACGKKGVRGVRWLYLPFFGGEKFEKLNIKNAV